MVMLVSYEKDNSSMFQSKMYLPIGFAVLVLCALSNVQCHLDLDGESVHSTVHYVKNAYVIYCTFTTVKMTIMITCPCNEYPLTPHFYIVKLGFTVVYFFIFLL